MKDLLSTILGGLYLAILIILILLSITFLGAMVLLVVASASVIVMEILALLPPLMKIEYLLAVTACFITGLITIALIIWAEEEGGNEE